MDEEPDAAEALGDQIEEIEDDEMPPWAGYLFDAWNALTNDRHRGDMGGCSGIYYQSISAYARDHGLMGDIFPDFYLFLRAMDDEYVAYAAKQAKAAAEKAKRERSA
ncbi:hypothetical protein DK26_15040 [Bosea sp. WAO]|uniref:phage tail assembly chaperone n=1 Tax=Bosea sp. WAO TaxID=406341 RepID=UPI000746D3DD|nr:hypothetical protein [Bosea sp. WAO]KUL94326.1 hypothetical protein DK26_15040 [Bosea sp. WAO]